MIHVYDSHAVINNSHLFSLSGLRLNRDEVVSIAKLDSLCRSVKKEKTIVRIYLTLPSTWFNARDDM